MLRKARFVTLVALGLMTLGRAAAQTPDIIGGVLIFSPLGEVIENHSQIYALQVVGVDHANRIVTFKMIGDLKGKGPDGLVEHYFTGFTADRDRQAIFEWARPGRTAVCFQKNDRARTCIGRTAAMPTNAGTWLLVVIGL